MKALLLDTETTGLISNGTIKLDKQPEIIELYMCEADLETGKISFEFDRLFKPSKSINAEITKITNITNDMVKSWETFSQWGNIIRKLLEEFNGKNIPIIAHNASYDKEMLDLEFERLRMKPQWPRVICTVEATIFMKGYRLSLSELHETLFGVKYSGAHRAKKDVQALLKCCVELNKRGLI